jgi:hypothetical protein
MNENTVVSQFGNKICETKRLTGAFSQTVIENYISIILFINSHSSFQWSRENGLKIEKFFAGKYFCSGEL